jgi:hypothetical protein
VLMEFDGSLKVWVLNKLRLRITLFLRDKTYKVEIAIKVKTNTIQNFNLSHARGQNYETLNSVKK